MCSFLLRLVICKEKVYFNEFANVHFLVFNLNMLANYSEYILR